VNDLVEGWSFVRILGCVALGMGIVNGGVYLYTEYSSYDHFYSLKYIETYLHPCFGYGIFFNYISSFFTHSTLSIR
jgi:hypothetical protein